MSECVYVRLLACLLRIVSRDKILRFKNTVVIIIVMIITIIIYSIHACQVRVTVGDPGLCCCTCVTSFERSLTPLFVDSVTSLVLGS